MNQFVWLSRYNDVLFKKQRLNRSSRKKFRSHVHRKKPWERQPSMTSNPKFLEDSSWLREEAIGYCHFFTAPNIISINWKHITEANIGQRFSGGCCDVLITGSRLQSTRRLTICTLRLLQRVLNPLLLPPQHFSVNQNCLWFNVKLFNVSLEKMCVVTWLGFFSLCFFCGGLWGLS